MRKITWISALIFAGLYCCGCTLSPHNVNVSISAFWNVPAEDNLNEHETLLWDTADVYDKAMRDGLIRGLSETTAFTSNYHEHSESGSISAVLRSFKEMVQDEPQTALIVGGIRQDETMQIASVSSFFNIPMLISFAKGNGLIVTDNHSTYQTTFTGKDVSDFLFGDLLGVEEVAQVLSSVYVDQPIGNETIDLAIFFEDSAFGESLAVDVASAAMNNGLNIGVYKKTEPSTIQNEISAIFVAEEANEDFTFLDLVVIITEDNTLNYRLIGDSANINGSPLFVFVSNSFSGTETIKNSFSGKALATVQVYAPDGCPADLPIFAYPGYGSAKLIDQVVSNAVKKLPNRNVFQQLIWRENLSDSEVKLLRSTIQQGFADFKGNVPCLGNVSFNSDGLMVDLQMELTDLTQDGYSTVDPTAFTQQLVNKIQHDITKKMEIER